MMTYKNCYYTIYGGIYIFKNKKILIKIKVIIFKNF